MSDLPGLPRLLELKEVAEQLRVSTKSVDRWIKRRELRSYKLGDRVLISMEDLLAFLEQHHRKCPPESTKVRR